MDCLFWHLARIGKVGITLEFTMCKGLGLSNTSPGRINLHTHTYNTIEQPVSHSNNVEPTHRRSLR